MKNTNIIIRCTNSSTAWKLLQLCSMCPLLFVANANIAITQPTAEQTDRQTFFRETIERLGLKTVEAGDSENLLPVGTQRISTVAGRIMPYQLENLDQRDSREEGQDGQPLEGLVNLLSAIPQVSPDENSAEAAERRAFEKSRQDAVDERNRNLGQTGVFVIE